MATTCRRRPFGPGVLSVLTRYRRRPFRSVNVVMGSDVTTASGTFSPKVRDVVGLYLDPPERALVLWVDEKTGIQILEPSSPVLSMMPGMPLVSPIWGEFEVVEQAP